MLVHIQITECVHYTRNVSETKFKTFNLEHKWMYISNGYNKFQDQDCINNLVDQDIFCLQETHCDLDQFAIILTPGHSQNDQHLQIWVLSLQ